MQVNQKDRGFLKGIRITAFLDCYQEWHAFVIGFCEVLCPWPPRCHCERSEAISAEYHYYMTGRGLGVIAWLVIAKIIQEAFF
jgi:hypothetical protein